MTSHTEAVDRLYKAARRLKSAAISDVAAAESALDEAVREALKVSVSNKQIQQITGLTPERIRAMRPRVLPKPRQPRTGVAQDKASTPLPAWWPPDVNESLRQQRDDDLPTVAASSSVWAIPAGLPSLGRRR